MSKTKLSVVIAARNEEELVEECLKSVRGMSDEIILVDDDSSDKTPEIAKRFGAKVYPYKHKNNFHRRGR